MTSAAKEIVGICLWECQNIWYLEDPGSFFFCNWGDFIYIPSTIHSWPCQTLFSGFRAWDKALDVSDNAGNTSLTWERPTDPDANSRMVDSLIFSAMMWCCLRGIMFGSFMCCLETVWASAAFKTCLESQCLTSSPRCVLEDMETTIPKTWPTIQVLHSATHSLSYFWSSSVASRTLLPFLRGLGKCQEASTFVARPSKIYVGPVITQRRGADPVRSPQKLKLWMSKSEEEIYTFNL